MFVVSFACPEPYAPFAQGRKGRVHDYDEGVGANGRRVGKQARRARLRWLLLQQVVDRRGDPVRIIFTRDIGDLAFLIHDNIDRERVGPSEPFVQSSVRPGARILESERKTGAEIRHEIPHAIHGVSVSVDRDHRYLVAVLLHEPIFDVWQLQTADRSKGCEVGEQRHLLLHL